MGFYSVVRPCVVGKLHYATVPVQPIEVDDEVAAPLVESGDLTPYGSPRISTEERAVFVESFFGDQQVEVTQVDGGEVITAAEPEKPRPRSRRKASED